jgi:hypothetical protein
LVGAIVTAIALISQWYDVLNKPFVLGHDGAAIHFLGTLGFLVFALSTTRLTLRRSLLISVLLFLPAAIFAAAMVRFTFIAIMGGLCVAGILGAAGQRRYIAMIAAALLTGVFAGMLARMDASKVLIDYAIQGIAVGRTDVIKPSSPPPAGMVGIPQISSRWIRLQCRDAGTGKICRLHLSWAAVSLCDLRRRPAVRSGA